MTDQMLKDALERIADRAEPVDGMAERALRGARRRRTVRVAGVAAVVTAAAVAVPFVGPFGMGVDSRGPDAALAGIRLPDNTPAERAIARGCLRDGPPAGHMGQDRPDLGGPGDFRLLVIVRTGYRHLALVGSKTGFVLCGGSATTGNADVPTFNPWWKKKFDGAFRVDAIQYVTPPGPEPESSDDDLIYTVAGRVGPKVAKVQVTFTGGRSTWATIDNGYFIAGTASGLVETKGVTGPMADGAMSTPDDEAVTSVRAYNAGGKVLRTWRPPPGEGGGFSPGDCADDTTSSPSLC